MKKIFIKMKYIHILVIAIGIIFILIPNFHTNLWFDESYTVGMVNRSFTEIWSIGTFDVHPILYYWILKIISLIFGNNILVYRLFSTLVIAILGIIGYTHIRKDFGEKCGLIFSFLILFMPTSLVYSGEIRMYSMGMLLVTLMAIYAYRIYKNGKNANWILFTIFSLASAYTHYYALIAAGITNLILFIYILRNSIKEKKEHNNKFWTKDLKKIIIVGVIQVSLYLPWLICLILQYKQVDAGFWIPDLSTETFLGIFNFQFSGSIDSAHISTKITYSLGIIVMIYAMWQSIESIKVNKKEINPAFIAILIYLGVIFVTFIVSLKTPVLYARYMLIVTGLFIFFLAYFMSKSKYNYITLVICILILMTSTIININLVKSNYAKINSEPIEYISSNIRKDDIILFSNGGICGFVITAKMPEYTKYFYNEERWNTKESYKAFGPEMITIYNLEELNEYEGRIWIISMYDSNLFDRLKEVYENKINLVEQKYYSTKYQNYQYFITLIEKGV